MKRKILVIDIGGSNVKLKVIGGRGGKRKFESGPTMTPEQMVEQVREIAKDWTCDVISIGFPGPVVHGGPAVDPKNLGKGGVNFDFEKALGKPVKIINDAAMQALGSYARGRMLFLGLGTGRGSALVLHDTRVPLARGAL